MQSIQTSTVIIYIYQCFLVCFSHFFQLPFHVHFRFSYRDERLTVDLYGTMMQHFNNVNLISQAHSDLFQNLNFDNNNPLLPIPLIPLPFCFPPPPITSHRIVHCYFCITIAWY
jgi:hypothetical protein